MIAAAILQSAYNNLYKELRKYIWDYETVVKLADLEVAAYMAFPNIDDIRRAYERLKSDVQSSDIYSDDEELKRALDKFEDSLEGADQIYYEVFAPEEVEVIESSEEEPYDGVFTGDIDIEEEENDENQEERDNSESEDSSTEEE
jgi:hypothetical protein